MKYQIKVAFKKILDSKDLIKKFVSLNSNQIYDFFKEIYTSDEISEHLNFITKEEFWQEILSMITGEKLESLDDLEKVAGGKISIKNRVLPGVLSLLMVGGSLVPGNTGVLTKDKVCSAWQITRSPVNFPEPKESPAVLNVINRNPTLKTMFGFAEEAHVTTLDDDHIAKYTSACFEPARAAEAASFPLMLVHAMPLLLQKWYKQKDLSINGLLKLFFDEQEKFSLTNFIGKLKGQQKSKEQENTATEDRSGPLSSFLAALGKGAVNMATPGKAWGDYVGSTETDLARIQLLTAYYIDYVHTTGATKFPDSQKLTTKLNVFFGDFYTDPQKTTMMPAVAYANTVLSGYIGTLQTLSEDAQEELLDVLKQRFPILNTVLGTFDQVKEITKNINNLTKTDSPNGIPAVVRKAVELISKFTGWHYSEETMKQIKMHLEEIRAKTDVNTVLTELKELNKIHGKRLTNPESEETTRVKCDGTPKQKELDKMMQELCTSYETLRGQPLFNSKVAAEPAIQDTKSLAKQILDFIKDTEEIRGDFDRILSDTRSLMDKLNKDDGNLQKILENLKVGLNKLQTENFFGNVAELPAELKKEWESLTSKTGLLGRATNVASNLEKITAFIANPWFASGVLGATGAALLEGTTGVFSKLLKGSMGCAKSAFANIRKSYNENIYNKLVLESDPIKLKKLVSEYLKSTLMFPGQISDNLAEILSSGKMSSEKPTMVELSGNVSSGVFSAVHKSVFKNNLETWQTINQSRVKPRIITRNLENGAKEKIELSLADTIFNTANPVIKKLLNNTSTTLVFENLTDSSIIDRLEEVRNNNGVLRLYDNNSGDYVEHDVSNTLFLISNRNNTDQRDRLKFAEQVHFGDFTEEEYAYIVAEKLGDVSASYYDKYKITVDFSDDFVENIARKAVKDHAEYDDAEKYLKPVTPAMIQFLDTEKSEGRPITKLKLECYEENEKIMFRHQEVLEKQKDVDQIEEISDGDSGDFLETREF